MQAQRDSEVLEELQKLEAARGVGRRGAAAAAARRGGGGGGDPDATLGQQRSYFPLRLSPNGARQLLFANFLLAMLQQPLW